MMDPLPTRDQLDPRLLVEKSKDLEWEPPGAKLNPAVDAVPVSFWFAWLYWSIVLGVSVGIFLLAIDAFLNMPAYVAADITLLISAAGGLLMALVMRWTHSHNLRQR